MSDFIKGEVLVPASRFIPNCECGAADVDWRLESFGDSKIVKFSVVCLACDTPYEQELPNGVEGIPSGQATAPEALTPLDVALIAAEDWSSIRIGSEFSSPPALERPT